MKLNHRKAFTESAKDTKKFHSKVTALCFSEDNKRLAVSTIDRVITLFDDRGAVVDKFNTKANDNGPKDYLIREIKFCPDSTCPKLAVAQSDAIVFIYKWTEQIERNEERDEWKGKKTICNKFPESSPICALDWPRKTPHQVVLGLFEGKVKIGNLRSNKCQTLFKGESHVVSLACNYDGSSLISGHGDGSIYRFVFPTKSCNSSCSKIIQHPGVPYSMAWGRSICVCDYDQAVQFYDDKGYEEQSFFYSSDISPEKLLGEFSCASFNASGDSVVIGSFDCFYLFCWNSSTNTWEESNIHIVENMCSVTAISWKPNGSSLAIGSSCGLVDIYDGVDRQYVYRDAFIVTYISPNNVLIQDKDDLNISPTLLQSALEINNISMYPEAGSTVYRYVVAKTKESLIICDMEKSTSTSELRWKEPEGSKSRFIFNDPNACIIYNAGELSVVEFGVNEIIGCFRTEFATASLLSLCLSKEVRTSRLCETKLVSYLLDQQTICLRDLPKKSHLTFHHGEIIDFLEINSRGTAIAFRDRKGGLYLYNIQSQHKTTFSSSCGYVQWVPGSDVLVAQNEDKICVWYNIRVPDQMAVGHIRGDIEGIERANGKTEVIIDEGSSIYMYPLSDDLISFGNALEDQDFIFCLDILENLESSVDQSRSMWEGLFDLSLGNWNLIVAKRSAAALGNVSSVKYLKRLLKCSESIGGSDPTGTNNSWKVKTKIYQMKSDLEKAEHIYLSHAKPEEAIAMYENLKMFSDASRVAHEANHPESFKKREEYYNCLLKSNQEEKAALLKEEEGSFIDAITLYTDAGFPGNAAFLINKHDILQPSSLLDRVATSLQNAGLFEQCGLMFERLSLQQKAISVYIDGKIYRSALRLTRMYFPGKVTDIEEKFGDYLVSIGSNEEAIEHFMESHSLQKAAETAVNAKLWPKAIDIASQLDENASSQLFITLATYLHKTGQYKDAERLMKKSSNYTYHDILSMYVEAGLWADAKNIAEKYLTTTDVQNVNILEGEVRKSEGNWDDAEMLFIVGGDVRKAVDMFLENRMFDRALLVTSSHDKSRYEDLGKLIASQFFSEGNIEEAEKYYTAVGDWVGAVNMYRENDLWDKAIECAEKIGGVEALRRTAYAYFLHLRRDKIESLEELGVLNHALDFAIDTSAYEDALHLADSSCSNMDVKEIHEKFAIYLEKQECFDDAEEQYLKANEAQGAIDMYVNRNMWTRAEQLAERLNSAFVSAVKHARNRAESNYTFDNNIDIMYSNVDEKGKGEPNIEAVRETTVDDDIRRKKEDDGGCQ